MVGRIMMRKVFGRPSRVQWVLALATAIGLGSEGFVSGQQRPQPSTPGTNSSDIEVLQVRPDLYMIAGAGANIAVQIGQDGVIVVDTGTGTKTEQVLAEIRKLTQQPIRYIINTNADPYVGGNKLRAVERYPDWRLNSIASAGGRAVIFAEERVLGRMSAPVGKQATYPTGAWPTSSYSASLGETQKDVDPEWSGRPGFPPA